MGLKIEFIDGQTPLSEEDALGLIITTITTKAELDEFEQQNISQAIKWTMGRGISTEKLLSRDYLIHLHNKMFGKVWKWAGQLRTNETNIGVRPHTIGLELRQLLDDAKYWIKKDVYSPNEIAIRFKHRLVSIHCFPNGNGRHSRLMADLILEKIFGQPYFSWGGDNLIKPSELRKQYISALKKADNGSIEDLLTFAQS